ncbi:hypothetical protein B0H17DRAFT_912446, partial [Mycena rosella]
GLLATWVPNLFDFYVDYMKLFYMYHHYPNLHCPFLNSIWCTITFNLGPMTCALSHCDFANLTSRWCAITALEYFDYKKGGHLILWDCKLIIELPPRTTILIPSTAIFHSNIPIADGEYWYSFTQYTTSKIFLWIEHRFKSEEAYLVMLTRRSRR